MHYISSPAGLIAIVVKEGSSYTYHYVHADHLGSILTVTNSSGVVEAEQNFDAWGRRCNTTTWAYTGVTAPPDWLYRGYTGHEHLAEFNLINLNGRLYDPVVGRVLSPDNFVQDPFSTQGFNRYSYGFNNPLKYSDPDGNNPLIGALIGALGYTLSVAFSDGGFSNWDWGQFAFATISGAVMAGFATGIGEVAQGIKNPILQASFQVAAHGLVGGYVSVAQGGEFGRGFLTSASGSLMGSATGALGFKGAAMIGASAITGGTVDAVFGGNFWKGAAQASIVATFNHAAHQLFDDPVYKYNEKTYTSKAELYAAILADQSMEQFGINDLIAIGGAVSGMPLLDKPFNAKNATKGTSVASKYLSKIPGEFPSQMKTLTGVPKLFGGNGIRISGTKLVGRFVGRWIPVLGWGMLAYDTGMALYNTQQIYNQITAVK